MSCSSSSSLGTYLKLSYINHYKHRLSTISITNKCSTYIITNPLRFDNQNIFFPKQKTGSRLSCSHKATFKFGFPFDVYFLSSPFRCFIFDLKIKYLTIQITAKITTKTIKYLIAPLTECSIQSVK